MENFELELSEVAVLVKNELHRILVLEKDMNDTDLIDSINSLRKRIACYNIEFFNLLLKAIWEERKLIRKRKEIPSEVDYDHEKKLRENYISEANEIKSLLEQAETKIELMAYPPKLMNYFLNNQIRKTIYYLEINNIYQQTIILLHDGDYVNAYAFAEKGIEKARAKKSELINQFPSRNFESSGYKDIINQFAGMKFESSGYKDIINKRWWEVKRKDFKNSAKQFDEAIKCYNRCKKAGTSYFQNNTTAMPTALSCLFSFMASPDFENVNYLLSLIHI